MSQVLVEDVHKSFGPLFNPASSDEVKAGARDMVGKKLDYVESKLGGQDYLGGDTMSVADPISSPCSGGPASSASTLPAGRT